MTGLSLIETMRWEPEAGFLRLDLHLARLANSAKTLGFPATEQAATALAAVAKGSSPLRVRLELFQDGRTEVTSVPFTPLPVDATWRIAIASTRLSSSDLLLRHKTSSRSLYDAARAEFSREDADEVLLLNERDELCEGTITSLFVEDDAGLLLTPPLSSGLLAGVLRTQLLCQKKARVQKLKIADLEHRTVYVGNSLRGLIRADCSPLQD